MASHCQECGTALERMPAFGKERQVCPNCKYVHFDDPKVAVGVVIEMDGGIVLCQRAHEPQIGRWSFPSGYVDSGEVLESAAIREVEEETGLVVKIERLLGAYSRAGERVVFIAYAGKPTGGSLVAGEECYDVAVFKLEALPEMAFPHDDAILKEWAASR